MSARRRSQVVVLRRFARGVCPLFHLFALPSVSVPDRLSGRTKYRGSFVADRYGAPRRIRRDRRRGKNLRPRTLRPEAAAIQPALRAPPTTPIAEMPAAAGTAVRARRRRARRRATHNAP